nr:RDD family protein [Sphingopyxis sp. JAI108]
MARLLLHPAARGCDVTAAANAKQRAVKAKKIRQFITPEGVDLELKIASAGLRFGALLVDLLLIVLTLFLFSLFMLWVGLASRSDVTVVVWMLGAFVLRTFWFIGFELGSRAATPGKRLMGIRVVARDGGRLTADAVVARNLIRELELFLPLMMLGAGASEDMVSGWIMLAGVLWSLTLSLFLLFNRDRMRMGDLIAGTWVVMAQRVKLDADIASDAAGEAMTFTDTELAVYGIFELQELERVLRGRDPRAMREVADAIRAKIGRPIAEEDDVFLLSYYRQLKARLERKLLFGNRREDKYASD